MYDVPLEVQLNEIRIAFIRMCETKDLRYFIIVYKFKNSKLLKWKVINQHENENVSVTDLNITNVSINKKWYFLIAGVLEDESPNDKDVSPT